MAHEKSPVSVVQRLSAAFVRADCRDRPVPTAGPEASHAPITRFLSGTDYASRDVWSLAKAAVRAVGTPSNHYCVAPTHAFCKRELLKLKHHPNHAHSGADSTAKHYGPVSSGLNGSVRNFSQSIGGIVCKSRQMAAANGIER